MWGGVSLVNGYSPIRPAGVAREFNFDTHGEIDFAIAKRLLEFEAGADGEMARLGIDGIIVASEMGLTPPADNWELAYSSVEGVVYHRRGPPWPRARSVPAIDSRPNEKFAAAEISGIVNSRNRFQADLVVPAGGAPALLTISRPFFNGYQAKIGNRTLKVDSYRGLIPVIELPAGTSGRLTMVYRPPWLLWGCGIAALSLLLMTGGVVGAAVSRQNRRDSYP
jgi:hypothetical protein